MHLAAPIMVDQRMSLPNARWSSNNVFPPPLFSLSLTLKHMQPLQKIRKGVWFVKLITFGCLFACIKFYLFYFQFDSLWFDFSIEFVILFYVF